MANDRGASLTKYAENLKVRLAGKIPPRYEKNPEAFRQMLEIDLRKTLLKIEQLRK